MELLNVLSRLLLCPGYHGLDPSSSSPAYLKKQTLYKTQKPPQTNHFLSLPYLFPSLENPLQKQKICWNYPNYYYYYHYLQGKLTKPWTSARPWPGEIYFSSKTYLFGKT
jgi:hypothetical protein